VTLFNNSGMERGRQRETARDSARQREGESDAKLRAKQSTCRGAEIPACRRGVRELDPPRLDAYRFLFVSATLSRADALAPDRDSLVMRGAPS
jgi:hypothetical protein